MKPYTIVRKGGRVSVVLVLMLALLACRMPADTDHDAPPEEDNAPAAQVITPEAAEGTLGRKLWDAFCGALQQSPDATDLQLAEQLVGNKEIIPFVGASLPIEQGASNYTGFGDYDVNGYQSAATFFPQIGAIPFVGYVFTLPTGADAAAFTRTLRERADPAWNVCAEADQIVSGAIGERVLFVMCRAASDQ